MTKGGSPHRVVRLPACAVVNTSCCLPFPAILQVKPYADIPCVQGCCKEAARAFCVHRVLRLGRWRATAVRASARSVSYREEVGEHLWPAPLAPRPRERSRCVFILAAHHPSYEQTTSQQEELIQHPLAQSVGLVVCYPSLQCYLL
jgi:hypothetical protein